MKIIYSGLESSGKSLRLAMEAERLVRRNSRWFKKTGILRPIHSNMHFSASFTQYAKEAGIPLEYWVNLGDLVLLDNVDIIIDEVGNYFNSRQWENLSTDVLSWLTQGAKRGIEIYGSAQDFAQVDKAFRRLVNELFLIRKIVGSGRPAATKPPIKRVWGICMVSQLDPQGYYEDKKKFVSGGIIPAFFTIQKKYCDIFDTTQKIQKGVLPPYQHMERFCSLPNCEFHKTIHA